jgi:hypothetical protein
MTQLGKSLHKGITSISSMKSMGTKPTIAGGNQVSVTPYEGTICNERSGKSFMCSFILWAIC